MEAVSFAAEVAHGTAAIGMVIATEVTLISFSQAALAFRSSDIRMAMDITLTAMAILPTVTDMAPGITGMGRDTMAMVPAITATDTMATATTAIVSTAAVITAATATMVIDQALPVDQTLSVCSNN